MNTLKFSRFRGSFLGLLFILVIAFGCSIDGEDKVQEFESLKDSKNVSKLFNSLSEDPRLAEDFAQALQNSKSNKSTYANSEILLRSNNKWAQIVNGGGTLNASTEFFAGYYISFQAKESQEGEDVGVIEFSNEEGEVIGYGDIDCLYVVDNQAFIRFLVDSQYYYIGFQDNGEGSNADPDLYTDTYVNFSNPPCEDFEAFITSISGFTKEWTEGNVQVH